MTNVDDLPSIRDLDPRTLSAKDQATLAQLTRPRPLAGTVIGGTLHRVALSAAAPPGSALSVAAQIYTDWMRGQYGPMPVEKVRLSVAGIAQRYKTSPRVAHDARWMLARQPDRVREHARC